MTGDQTIHIEYLDGRIEDIYGDPRTADGVLTIVEHYGVTGGVKQITRIPLSSIRRWSYKG